MCILYFYTILLLYNTKKKTKHHLAHSETGGEGRSFPFFAVVPLPHGGAPPHRGTPSFRPCHHNVAPAPYRRHTSLLSWSPRLLPASCRCCCPILILVPVVSSSSGSSLSIRHRALVVCLPLAPSLPSHCCSPFHTVSSCSWRQLGVLRWCGHHGPLWSLWSLW